MKYTNKEIQENIQKLENKQNKLKENRTTITKEINQIKKQIEYWLSIDESQTKLF